MIRTKKLLLFVAIAISVCAAFLFGVAVSNEVSYADGTIVVTEQPESVSVVYGENAILHAEGSTPSSEPITYRWYKVGSDVAVGSGKNLTLTAINQSGRYYCNMSAEIGGHNRTVDTATVTVTISIRPVKIAVSSPSSEYGEAIVPIPYDLAEGQSLAYDDVLDDLNVVLNKATGINAGRYEITGTYNNPDYAVTFLPATYTITPKRIEGRLIGADGLTYTGKTPAITAELIGLPESDNVRPVLSFNKAVKNAGEYVAYLRTDNPNYAVADEEVNFRVAKAPLVVSVGETVLRVGGEVKPNYAYRGFVNGETDEVLTTKPSVNMTTERAGSFEVTPFGAEAANYEISYESGTVKVNVSTVVKDNVIANGSFDYNGHATVETVEAVSLNINKLNVYSVELAGAEPYGEYTVTVSKMKKYPTIFLRGAVVDGEGKRHAAVKYGYNGEDFVYTADVAGKFVLYYDLTVPAIIVFILFVTMLVLIGVRGKDRKRYKRLRKRQYIAQQYAERCRVRDTEE